MTTKETLKGSYSDVLADIRGINWNGQLVYPDYPAGYERSLGPNLRFIVTPPIHEVIEPGTYDENGNELTAPVMGEWVSHLVLPEGYPTNTLTTLLSE